MPGDCAAPLQSGCRYERELRAHVWFHAGQGLRIPTRGTCLEVDVAVLAKNESSLTVVMKLVSAYGPLCPFAKQPY
jgi:hypothetical protein